MKRHSQVRALEDRSAPWDLVIVGGGATGLGCGIEAASRGYDTLLLEMDDFAKATSSRSTKLVHGGVRYLEQGNVSLVFEALRERGLLEKNAPHVVRRLPFVVPNYKWWEGPYYGLGMKVYDLLARGYSFGSSKNLSRSETLDRIPTARADGLRGGVLYYDGQFDDARLAVNMAQTVVEQGGTTVNYMKVTSLLKDNAAQIHGVVAECQETGTTFKIHAEAVINATGIFTDSIRKMDDPSVDPTLRPAQGTHIVLDRSFLPGESAIMIPKTDDGRVLFAIPWHDRVVVGTTDDEVEQPELEPRPTKKEVDYLLDHAGRYLSTPPEPDDVRSVFAGIRPLVSDPGKSSSGRTREISREHVLHVSPSGLVTISGGKWTTYRKMAQDAIDRAATSANLDERPSVTKELHIHGWHQYPDRFDEFARYGSDAPALQQLARERPELKETLHQRLPIRGVHVVWAARHEMARTVEDVLARRTRCLLLDAEASIDVAPRVAELMADEKGYDAEWQQEQVEAFTNVARGYLLCDGVP